MQDSGFAGANQRPGPAGPRKDRSKPTKDCRCSLIDAELEYPRPPRNHCMRLVRSVRAGPSILLGSKSQLYARCAIRDNCIQVGPVEQTCRQSLMYNCYTMAGYNSLLYSEPESEVDYILVRQARRHPDWWVFKGPGIRHELGDQSRSLTQGGLRGDTSSWSILAPALMARAQSLDSLPQ
jgi:hypothetical protein